MATQADFWGEIQVDEIRTPVAILREQAALLGPKTHNIVEARVFTQTVGPMFSHEFNMIVPALDNYTYRLFEVRHPIELYPISVIGEGRSLRDEPTFTAWLQERLSSNEVKRVIANLVSQVRDQ